MILLHVSFVFCVQWFSYELVYIPAQWQSCTFPKWFRSFFGNLGVLYTWTSWVQEAPFVVMQVHLDHQEPFHQKMTHELAIGQGLGQHFQSLLFHQASVGRKFSFSISSGGSGGTESAWGAEVLYLKPYISWCCRCRGRNRYTCMVWLRLLAVVVGVVCLKPGGRTVAVVALCSRHLVEWSIKTPLQGNEPRLLSFLDRLRFLL